MVGGPGACVARRPSSVTAYCQQQSPRHLRPVCDTTTSARLFVASIRMAQNRVMTGEQATVVGVSADGEHQFSKTSIEAITLLQGLGVRGDAHVGITVQHRSRVAVDPTQPNLRQVHLIHAELFAELMDQGFQVEPGQLGENITTTGLALLDLPRGTHLHIGSDAILEVTGLRNPCAQINAFRPGLLNAVLRRDQDGAVVRKAGIMSIVVRGGLVRPSDPIEVRLPAGPFQQLERV